MKKRVLLIIDLQKDFLPGGALPVPEGDRVIPVINQLQEKFSIIVATKDWHPKEHVSFAINHAKNPGDTVEIKGIWHDLWPIHCVQETKGADFSDDLLQEKIHRVFYKGVDTDIDSYSAFFDNAHERSTGLTDYLKEEEIKEIYLVGLATDYCVKFSALDALELGFSTYVILDGCRGIDAKPGDIEKAIEEMRRKGVHFLLSKEIKGEE